MAKSSHGGKSAEYLDETCLSSELKASFMNGRVPLEYTSENEHLRVATRSAIVRKRGYWIDMFNMQSHWECHMETECDKRHVSTDKVPAIVLIHTCYQFWDVLLDLGDVQCDGRESKCATRAYQKISVFQESAVSHSRCISPYTYMLCMMHVK